MTIPSLDQIKSLHQKYAASPKVFEQIYDHSQIVWEIAKQLIDYEDLQIDPKLVQSGCLLHDIGVYKLVDAQGVYDEENYILHGLYGYEILKNEGVAESICRMAKLHTGVGISAKEIREKHLPLPEEDFFAETEEEKLVMYADKFHSKGDNFNLNFNSFQSAVAKVKKFWKEDATRLEELTQKFGQPDLETLAQKYHQPIR